MDRRRFLGAAATVTAGSLISSSCATDGPEPAESDDAVTKVRRAMLAMQRYSWEQGVAAQALLEWGDLDTVILMAKDAVLRQWDDGRLAVVSENHGVTDPASNGEPVLRAAEATGDPALAAGALKMLDYLMEKAPRTENGVLHHVDHKPQVWIDSAFMAPPFLAVAGEPTEAVRQIRGMRDLLWNEGSRLFHHIWDDGEKVFHREPFWGVGNGWAAAGITRIIAALPPAMETERAEMVAVVTEILDGCLALQRPDGLFHDFLDQPSTFVETNLAQMLAYSIYRGVGGGWLDAAYLEAAHTMRAAAQAKVDDLGLVQGVCGAPLFESSGTATEGQAFFILMEAAHRDLHANDQGD